MKPLKRNYYNSGDDRCYVISKLELLLLITTKHTRVRASFNVLCAVKVVVLDVVVESGLVL